MKKIIFGLILMLTSNLALNSQNLLPKDFESVGINHNLMVDEAFNLYLKGNPKTNLKSSTITVLSDYLKNIKDYSPEDIRLGVLNIENTFNNSFDLTTEKLYKKEHIQFLSKSTINFLDQLEVLLKKDYKSVDEFKLTISNFENTITKSKLDNKDLTILFSATNIAKYSFEYWFNNYDKWLALKGLNNKGGGGPGPKRIFYADIAGGVSGAAGALIVNLLPGAGQVAYGGAIVGGAVASSVYVAIEIVLDWWNP